MSRLHDIPESSFHQRHINWKEKKKNKGSKLKKNE
ncbi:MAG: hypothetical protein JW774_10375 [Candidatus Aureabacteria bacterium]|nr:hypothetical protein [Candidatus Auribacterota bacterium]